MSLYYKPFDQSRPPTKLKGVAFDPMNFHFIDASTSCLLVNSCVESAPNRVPCLALLGGEISPPHLILLLLMQILADDGEPKKFYPLDSFAPEDLYPLDTSFAPADLYPLETFVPEHFLTLEDFLAALIIIVFSPMSGMEEEPFARSGAQTCPV